MAVNATAAALLGLLRDGAASGYELAQRATAELGDFWTVTRSQVYRELTGLADQGLVEVGQTGARSRREHRLTASGRVAFREWLAAEPGADVVRIPLLLRLAFADELDPARLRELVSTQRAAHAERLARYRELEAAALATGGTDRDLVTLRFGLRYEEAVLRWFDEELGPGGWVSGRRG
ncbi:MAG TPA: helix-turn-helix transcriptional regulator [Mycobacteriales bacterium]|nr:helix-turn-helix transcriptional regulator [Mycobacteriales bacterium]